MQCLTARSKGNIFLGFIAHNFDCKTPEVITRLYTAVVRPHLEYAVHFWSPCFEKDIKKLESMQRKAIKLFPGICGLSYDKSLKRLYMFFSRDRYIRGDHTETIKIMKSIDEMYY